MYILYIIVLKIKLITNLHALSVAIHVHSNNDRHIDKYIVTSFNNNHLVSGESQVIYDVSSVYE